VALGNAPGSPEVAAALLARADDPSPQVRRHVAWALERHGLQRSSSVTFAAP
jgi:epoxyqueuosine reductase